MITKEQASSLHHGDLIHYGKCKKVVGPRGGVRRKIVRLRITGRLRLWARTPEKWEIPIKYGYYDTYRLSDRNCSDFHLENECEVLFPKGGQE